MVVDYQTHWYPPASLELIEGRRRRPRSQRVAGGYVFEDPSGDTFELGQRFIDLETQIASMDENGVDVMVCSPTTVGDVAELEPARAREQLELVNEQISAAQREHPARFVGLAMLPMQDVESALAVLDRAVGELELRGVCVLSHIAGGPIADSRTLPIYERIEALDVPLFLHPANHSSVYRDDEPLCVERGVNWLIDTTKAALSLIVSGILDACPRLVVVHPHAGGVLPYVADRMASAMRREPPSQASRSLDEYLRENFFVDSCSETPGALRMAVEAYGLERVLLASDYPWQSRADRLRYVRDNADVAQAEAIHSRNVLPNLILPTTDD